MFKLSKAKHLKYFKLKTINTMFFTAYILDLCYKASIIAIIIPNQHNKLLKIVKEYIIIK
jgi:hypothetical protein